jgi:hypothetical protein
MKQICRPLGDVRPRGEAQQTERTPVKRSLSMSLNSSVSGETLPVINWIHASFVILLAAFAALLAWLNRFDRS